MRKSAESADGQNAESGGLAEKGKTSSRGGSRAREVPRWNIAAERGLSSGTPGDSNERRRSSRWARHEVSERLNTRIKMETRRSMKKKFLLEEKIFVSKVLIN